MSDEVVENYSGRITRSMKKIKKRPLSPSPIYSSTTRRKSKITPSESASPSVVSDSKKRTRRGRKSSFAESIRDEENEGDNEDDINKRRALVEVVVSATQEQQFPLEVSSSSPNVSTFAAVAVSSPRVLSTNDKRPKLSPVGVSGDLR